jgi:hypothetical protein
LRRWLAFPPSQWGQIGPSFPCGADNRPGHRFCVQCGAALATCGEVHRLRGHGGVGQPQAREDDAERAAGAALALTQSLTALGQEVGVPELRATAGVLTGRGAVELGAESEGMVLGDTVNTASRLQSIANPGSDARARCYRSWEQDLVAARRSSRIVRVSGTRPWRSARASKPRVKRASFASQRSFKLSLTRGQLQRARGLLHAQRGELQQAEAELAEAVVVIGDSGNPFALARTTLDHGQICRAAPHRGGRGRAPEGPLDLRAPAREALDRTDRPPAEARCARGRLTGSRVAATVSLPARSC